MNRLPVCPQRDGDLARRGSGVEGQDQFRFFAGSFSGCVRRSRRATYRVGFSAFQPTMMRPTSGPPAVYPDERAAPVAKSRANGCSLCTGDHARPRNIPPST
jgi:hypothetical protein